MSPQKSLRVRPYEARDCFPMCADCVSLHGSVMPEANGIKARYFHLNGSLRVLKANAGCWALSVTSVVVKAGQAVADVTLMKGASGRPCQRSSAGGLAMEDPSMSRRGVLRLAVAALGVLWSAPRFAASAVPEIMLPMEIAEQKPDFETKGLEGWTTVNGRWLVEEMPGVPVGTKALVQRATTNEVNVIVAPSGPITDLDVSVKFDPLSGKEDASGGIVFRFSNYTYYVLRASALENNFRLYAYDGGLRQLASASVKAPALGQWHLLRVAAIGDHIQGWLDGTLLLDHRDARFKAGRVGLWTKADSITAFNDLTIRGLSGRT